MIIILPSAIDGGKIDIWRLPEGDNVATLSRSGCGITCMSLKGAWLYCGRTRGTIEVWNIESKSVKYLGYTDHQM